MSSVSLHLPQTDDKKLQFHHRIRSLFFLLLFLYHPLRSFPLRSSLLPLLLFLPSPLLFLAGVASAAVPPEASQEVRPEAAEGAGVATGPVRCSDVLLQPAGKEEGTLAVFAVVRSFNIVGTHHVTDGETCNDMRGEKDELLRRTKVDL